MDKQPIHGSSRLKRLISGRGFYVALAACLLAIGGMTIATFGDALFVRQPAESSDPVSDTRVVEQPITNQPDERKTTTTPAPTEPATTTASPPAADLYILPLSNAVQKEYSNGALVYSVTMRDWRTHDGTDFAGDSGQTVKALADGVVTAVESNPFWGEQLVIDHGANVVSYYSGVKATVAVGDAVQAGQAVGTLTEIPCEAAQGAHLHLEMTVDGQPVDPVKALGREVRSAANDE